MKMLPRHRLSGTAMGEPARGYTKTHPPFEAGNTVALKHGAYSSRHVEPLARRIADTLVEVAPWSAAPTFAAARRAWSWAEAEAELLRAFVNEHGLLDTEGEERPAAKALHRAEAKARNLRSDLGLDPMSCAKLMSLVAGLDAALPDDARDQLLAEGRRILEARANG